MNRLDDFRKSVEEPKKKHHFDDKFNENVGSE
jgi:hypothetical protein